jgi:signal transduction histidine kinase/CheY-like chemotaxis protein
MAENPIFASFLTEQGYALFEYAGQGVFHAVGNFPAWCQKLWGATGGREKTLRLAEQSPFLENFIVDAEGFWNSKRKGAANSPVWIERDLENHETPLEAWALRLEGKKVLIVRNLSGTYTERQQLFQTARDSLLEHDRLLHEVQKKEILLHCIIHDLSQPLNAMRGCFNILATEKLPGEQLRMVETGQRESVRQEQMIRGILEAFSADLATQQAPSTAVPNAPDLAACAQRMVEQMSPAYQERGIRLQLDPRLDLSRDWKVAGDAPRIERIFGNLLENALRYTPKGAGVTVGVEDKVHCLLAFVDDEGPGLPKDATPDRLFALFAKGKDRPGKAGLGLYFCKITVERWGGNIGAENRPGGGSRFWFKLPCAMKTQQNRGTEKAASAAKPPEPPAPFKIGKAAKKLRILVAEDTEVNRELVTEILNKRGHSVVAVADGRQAVAALAKQRFDVVLMDEQMPGMDGLEATRAVRELERSSGKHQFILGVTGNVSAEDNVRRIEAGMDGFLTKPFEMQVLFRTIEAGPAAAPLPAAASAPAAPAASAPAAESVADSLRRASGGNEELARSLVASFLADAPKKLADIRRAVTKNNAAKLASAAHGLKGAAAIFGAPAVVAAARNLEAMGKAGTVRDAEKEFLALEEAFVRLHADLLALAPHSKPSAAKPPSKRKK